MFKVSHITRMLVVTGLCLSFAAQALGDEAYEQSGKKHSWFSFSRPAKKNSADQMAYAQELLKNNKLKRAGKAFHALVMTWPGSNEAPMAQWAYARILDNRGEKLDAFDEYETLLTDYSGHFPDYEKALGRQFEIATNLMFTRKGSFLLFPGFEAPERAIPLLEKIVQNGPRSKYAPEAQYRIGQAYEESFEDELAVVAYIATLHRYPLSPFAELAAFGRARSLNNICTRYPNDVQALEEAWSGVMVFLRAFPNSTYAEEAITMRNELLDRKARTAFEIANFYDKKAKKPDAAAQSYKTFVELYPNSAWTETAKQRMMVLAAKTDKKDLTRDVTNE